MGTRFELVLEGRDPWALRAAGEAAIERIEAAHSALSRFDAASLLAHLRRAAPRPVTVDLDTFRFLSAMAAVRSASAGAFDPGHPNGPAGASLILDLERQTAALSAGSPLPDFGGCAKGWAIDLAVDTLRQAGIEAAFLHGGTSSGFGLGHPAGRPGWPVAIGPEAADPVVVLRDQAFSVSRSVVPRGGNRVPHTVDPRTGTPVLADLQVVVVGPAAAEADAWSTALVVAGRRHPALDDRWRTWLRHGDGPWLVEGTGRG